MERPLFVFELWNAIIFGFTYSFYDLAPIQTSLEINKDLKRI